MLHQQPVNTRFHALAQRFPKFGAAVRQPDATSVHTTTASTCACIPNGLAGQGFTGDGIQVADPKDPLTLGAARV
jgi:hypothetical protein